MLVEIKILECHYILRRIMQGIKKSENSRKYVIPGRATIKNRGRNYRIAMGLKPVAMEKAGLQYVYLCIL